MLLFKNKFIELRFNDLYTGGTINSKFKQINLK